MKSKVDSLYKASKDSLQLDIDKNCDLRFTSIYQHAIDSIQDIRQEEILNLLDQ